MTIDLRLRVTFFREYVGPRYSFASWRWGIDAVVAGRGVEAHLLPTHSKESAAIDEGRTDYRVTPL